MNCLLCGSPEIKFNLNRNQLETVKHPKDVKEIICSNCTQVLIATSQEKIKAAYQKALHASLLDKAKALETFLEEEIIENGETKKPSRDMGRIRALRKIRPAGHKVRPKHTIRQLDKRRVAVC